MEDISNGEAKERIELMETDNTTSIGSDSTNNDDTQIHLTVEDAVTQIEIETNEHDERNTNDDIMTDSVPIDTMDHIPKNDHNTTSNDENNGNFIQQTSALNLESNAHNDSDSKQTTDISMNDTDSCTTDNKPPTSRIRRCHTDEEEEEDEIDGRIEETDRSTNDDDEHFSMKNCPASNPEDPDDNFDPTAACGVCWGKTVFTGDCLVYCDGCNVPLHQTCYCIHQVPQGEFYCKVCQYQVDSAGKPERAKDFLGRKCKCSICQLRFRSKKLAYTSQRMNASDKKQKWCHVICAQYVSETWFDENQTDLNGVCNVEGIREKRKLFECAYCARSKGAKVFCSIVGCHTKFHASCGLVNKCLLQDVADPAAEYSNRVVYCPVHTPKEIKKSGNILLKKRLQQSQDITLNANQNNMGWGETWDMKIQTLRTTSHNRLMFDEEDDDEGYVMERKRKTNRKRTKNLKKGEEKMTKRMKSRSNMRGLFAFTEPPPLAPIYSRRGGFFSATRPTGPRSMGAGPGHRAKKKFAANHKKRKEAPKLNGNSEVQEPPNKKQRIVPPAYNKTPNPKLIPKRTMPKYSASPLSKERDKREKEKREREKERERMKTKETAQQLIARTAPKKFEQKGKVRLIKPNIAPLQSHSHSLHNRTQQQPQMQPHDVHNIIPPQQPQLPPPQPIPPQMQPPPTPYKVFPKRPQEIWNTRMIHQGEISKSGGSDIGKLDFKVTFVWRAGCTLEWPFANISVMDKSKKLRENIHCSWKKDFAEIEKYMKEIRPGGKKQHLSHHWMLCEIHPYSTDDVSSYGDFCNYYKDLCKVSAAMCKSAKHQHLLFYLCPPDEVVLPETYLDDIFHCKIPKGLLWCLIFIKNLNLPTQNSVTAHSSVNSNTKCLKQQDPRKKHKEKRKKKEKEKEKSKEKEKVKIKIKEKERNVPLGVDVDGGNLLGMLDGLSNTLKDEANINDDNDNDEQIKLTNSPKF